MFFSSLEFHKSIDSSRRMIDDTAEIGGRPLVVLAGGLENGEKDIGLHASARWKVLLD